jgi:hypothetical protein
VLSETVSSLDTSPIDDPPCFSPADASGKILAADLPIMNRSAYDETLALLAAAGLRTLDSRYDDQASGSWWIEVGATPPRRIVWDGKDRWAIVQVARGQRSAEDVDLWEDRWIGRHLDERTPATLVQETRRAAV